MKIKNNNKKIYFFGLAVVFTIALVWSYTFGFFHTSEWDIPTGYGGDLYWVLLMAKSYLTTEVLLLFLKELK